MEQCVVLLCKSHQDRNVYFTYVPCTIERDEPCAPRVYGLVATPIPPAMNKTIMSTDPHRSEDVGLVPHSVGFPLRIPQSGISHPASRSPPTARTPIFTPDPISEVGESADTTPEAFLPLDIPPSDSPSSVIDLTLPTEKIGVVYPEALPSASGETPIDFSVFPSRLDRASPAGGNPGSGRGGASGVSPPPPNPRPYYVFGPVHHTGGSPPPNPPSPFPLSSQSHPADTTPELPLDIQPAERTSLTETIRVVYPETPISAYGETPIDLGVLSSSSHHTLPAGGKSGSGAGGCGKASSTSAPRLSPHSSDFFGLAHYDHDTGGSPPSNKSPPSPHLSQSFRLPRPASSGYTIDQFFTPPTIQGSQPFRGGDWIEYLLPDESFYYVHPTGQLIADIDLRDAKLFDAMKTYIENHYDDPVVPNQELWLRDTRSCENRFLPLRCWVNHREQSVAFDRSPGSDNNGDPPQPEDDRLDAKFRYWSFMEAHPAHISLPQNVQQEAMKALTWFSTPQSLASQHSPPTPFTLAESQELKTLLQSFERATSGEPDPRHTLIVSKILLKMVRWRQLHFRPQKALPDVGVRYSKPSPSSASGGAG
ncbi:hypothetical protein BD779DRAFT_496564 [Infundibulicybe gibba]|nr:hypothetical protein BD779DRAFT_496564 [Infundibulicybe gibba]